MNPQIKSMNYTRNRSSATRARIQLLGNKTLRFSVHITPLPVRGDATPDRQAARAEERMQERREWIRYSAKASRGRGLPTLTMRRR
jgi:hypothetical protein